MKKLLRLFFLLFATSMMMAQLNAQTILCVDRDFGSSPDSNYTDTWYMIKSGLDMAGYTYEHWDVIEDDDYVSDTLQEELDYELFEQEKEESDSEDFPDTFEEWKLQKQEERWNFEDETANSELMEEFEE